MSEFSLEYFIVLAEQLNITRAAALLHISQQSLSTYLKKLEQEYGTQLITRKPQMQLTEAGKKVLISAKKIRQIYDELKPELARLEEEKKVTLSLGIFAPIVERAMMHLPITEIGSRYKDVSFRITSGFNVDLFHQLNEGKLDLAILASVRGVEEIEDYVCRKLEMDEECVMVRTEVLRKHFSEQYPDCIRRFQEGVDIAELASIPMVLPPPNSGVTLKIRQYLDEQKQNYTVRGEGGSQLVSNMMVQKDDVLGFCSKEISPRIADIKDSMCVFPIRKPVLTRNIVLVYKKTDHYPEYFSEITDLICSRWKNNAI